MVRYASLLMIILLGTVTLTGSSCMYVDLRPVSELLADDDIAREPQIIWWSNDDPEPQPLSDDSIIEGDLIRVEASFEENEENPEAQINTISWVASKGLIVNRSGSLLIPEEEYDPFFMGVDLQQFRWEYIENIQLGDFVQLDLFHSNNDTDVLLFWNNTATIGWTAGTSILGLGMATANLGFESGSFFADRDGVLAVGIYSYDKQAGEYLLTVDTRESETGTTQGSSIRYDTWRWGRNITIDFEFTGTAVNGMIRKMSLSNVTFRNFFQPVVMNVDVLSQGNIKQVTWDVLDRNRFESHHYEVLVSLDGGFSFQLVAAGLQTQSYAWNIAGYGRFDRCQIQVRAYDDVGLQGVGYSPLFVVSSSNGAANERWFTTSSTGNLTYIWGSSGNEVTWSVWIIDSMPLLYQIRIDDTITSTGWTSGGELVVVVDGLEIGLHEVMLSIDTGSGLFNESVIVEVIPDSSQYLRQALTTFAAVMILIAGISAIEIKRRL
ncbi:MAG: hypothetical protein ACFFED_10375 [Candidatus Thorarchaeota archaeon]